MALEVRIPVVGAEPDLDFGCGAPVRLQGLTLHRAAPADPPVENPPLARLEPQRAILLAQELLAAEELDRQRDVRGQAFERTATVHVRPRLAGRLVQRDECVLFLLDTLQRRVRNLDLQPRVRLAARVGHAHVESRRAEETHVAGRRWSFVALQKNVAWRVARVLHARVARGPGRVGEPHGPVRGADLRDLSRVLRERISRHALDARSGEREPALAVHDAPEPDEAELRRQLDDDLTPLER